MGERWKSKTLVPSQFGDTREEPEATLLVLRSWMLHRLLANGFADSKRCRREVYERELKRLQADIAELGGVENEKARACIAEWAPAALNAWAKHARQQQDPDASSHSACHVTHCHRQRRAACRVDSVGLTACALVLQR